MADAALLARASGVAAAREALLAWVDDAGAVGRRFLQARLLATAGDRYEVRPVADVGLPLDDLHATSDPYHAREIAQTDAAGEHRPLKTAPTLRRGWVLTDLDRAGLWTALDYLYPACAVHWYGGRVRSLHATPWEETAARQSGMYAAVGQLPREAVSRAVAACCADVVCLRTVAWHDPAATIRPPTNLEEARIPCPEACSIFVSFARAILTVEREPRAEVPGLGALAPSETEQIRAVTATAVVARPLDPVREGDFSASLNQRRLRYLGLRLNPGVSS